MAGVDSDGNGRRQQRRMTKAADDDGTQDCAADYEGEEESGQQTTMAVGQWPARQRACNKNKEIEFTQKDLFSAIRSVRLEFLLLPKTNYPCFRFISLIYNQVLDYLQLRYVVIINNHDLILIIYNSMYIIYNTSNITNNHVLQLVLFIKTV
jgi:hypothetical protein